MTDIDFRDLEIRDYKHWTLFLNKYQCYLGRLCLTAKRPDAKDFMEMTKEEQEEFFTIGKEIKRVLTKLFSPDLMNYASLGNNFKHLHVHIIPRYEKVREWGGQEFVDKRWGSNYAPYDREFRLPLSALLEIKKAIAAELS